MSEMIRVRVAGKEQIALDICAFELMPLEGELLPAFAAGAHIDVRLPSGAVRQYSLCNPQDESRRYRIAVLREGSGRGGSRAMHDAIQVGEVLCVSSPRNLFELESSDIPSLLMAGGIGITPILAMAHELEAAGKDFQLHYCTRNAARTAFLDELQQCFGDRARIHHDEGVPQQRLDIDLALKGAADGAHLYVCGPAGFIEAVLGRARALGWPEGRLHREFFAAGPADSASDGAFEVVVASTGAVVTVAPQETVVAALAAIGIEVMTSCEQGVCGTCATRVLDGIPEHRDVYFTDDEREKGDQFTPCCSRSRTGRLVLDL